MPMTPKTKPIAIAGSIVVIGIVVGVRFLMLVPCPVGEHNWVESPDERHRAYVHKLTDKDFFGGTREFYRFEVQMKSPDGRLVTVFEKDIPPAYIQVSIDLTDLGDIVEWSHDSVSVIYLLGDQDVEVVLPFSG
jgi:hypothetical protein